MLEQSLRNRIEVYLKQNYLEIVSNDCELWEKKIPGRTRLKVVLPGTVCALCITDYDNKSKCEFLNDLSQYGLRKSVDHVLLTPNSNGTWTVHLIEMKTGLSQDKWKDISQKTCASMLNVKALAAILEMCFDTIDR